MKIYADRFKIALRAATAHLCLSLLVAVSAAALVFLVWFPGEFREMAGGRELFLLVTVVDVICGPLLTLVLFNPLKSARELVLDMALVGVLQVIALAYGLWTVTNVRPLYLVAEVDRFKVISGYQVEPTSLRSLPANLERRFWHGPLTVGLRPLTGEERNTVLFESVEGGRDYGERPEYFVEYDAQQGLKSITHAKDFDKFLRKYPEHVQELQAIALRSGNQVSTLKYLPIIARQDWIAVVDPTGRVIGFLKGDGF